MSKVAYDDAVHALVSQHVRASSAEAIIDLIQNGVEAKDGEVKQPAPAAESGE